MKATKGGVLNMKRLMQLHRLDEVRQRQDRTHSRKCQYLNRFLVLLRIAICGLLLLLCPSFAQAEDEISALDLYYGKEDLVVTPSRTPKRISQTAENVIVITAKELEEMNAHTLEEALNLVAGVTMESVFHSTGGTYIQGATGFHVKMMIDGVVLNDLSTNLASAGLMPVQFIERIEIIKGPASSSWGSSLGGTINIITKTPTDSGSGGLLSTSYGKDSTRDNRAELSGKVKTFGYYLQGGENASNGFTQGSGADHDAYYAKITDAATDKLNLAFTTLYGRERFEIGDNWAQDLRSDDKLELLVSTLSMNYQLSSASDISLSLRTKTLTEYLRDVQLSTVTELNSISERDETNGASVQFSSRQGANTFVIGAEYENEKLVENSEVPTLSLAYNIDQRRHKDAFFANDTIALGRFTVTPGIRYDYISDNDDFTSPSLGVTYRLTGDTLLRAYAARGFGAAPFVYQFGEVNLRPNAEIKNEKIESMQTGFETTAVPYLWLKASVFKHSVWDAFAEQVFDDGTSQMVNAGKERLQGVELEAKTTPVYHTSLIGNMTLISIKDRDTGSTIPYRPSATYNVIVKYKDKRSLGIMLAGHYVKWTLPSDLTSFAGDPTLTNSVIWDAHLTKELWSSEMASAEVFLSVHNVFDGKQYAYYLADSTVPARWSEAGVRLKF